MKSIISIIVVLGLVILKPEGYGNKVVVVDLTDTLQKYENDFEKIKEITIGRNNINDSILVKSPIIGTSTCVEILKDSTYITDVWKNRISGNCGSLSELNLTKIEDGDYTLEYISCFVDLRVKIKIITR